MQSNKNLSLQNVALILSCESAQQLQEAIATTIKPIGVKQKDHLQALLREALRSKYYEGQKIQEATIERLLEQTKEILIALRDAQINSRIVGAFSEEFLSVLADARAQYPQQCSSKVLLLLSELKPPIISELQSEASLINQRFGQSIRQKQRKQLFWQERQRRQGMLAQSAFYQKCKSYLDESDPQNYNYYCIKQYVQMQKGMVRDRNSSLRCLFATNYDCYGESQDRQKQRYQRQVQGMKNLAASAYIVYAENQIEAQNGQLKYDIYENLSGTTSQQVAAEVMYFLENYGSDKWDYDKIPQLKQSFNKKSDYVQDLNSSLRLMLFEKSQTLNQLKQFEANILKGQLDAQQGSINLGKLKRKLEDWRLKFKEMEQNQIRANKQLRLIMQDLQAAIQVENKQKQALFKDEKSAFQAEDQRLRNLKVALQQPSINERNSKMAETE